MKPNDKRQIALMRIKSYYIILIGLFLITITYFSDKLFTGDERLFTILLNFGVSFATVGVIAFLWDTLGGDPITNAIRRIHKQLLFRDIGLRDVQIRKSTESGAVFNELQGEIKAGAHVDLMGLVLQREWFNKEEFRKKCLDVLNAKKSCRFRILLPKPFDSKNGSKNLYQRVVDEQIRQPDSSIERAAEKMSISIEETLGELCTIYQKMDDGNKPRLQVRVNADNYISCSVLRVNRRMFVINYLHKKGGRNTPMLLLEGANTELFKIYMEEFETVFEASSVWDLQNNQIKQ